MLGAGGVPVYWPGGWKMVSKTWMKYLWRNHDVEECAITFGKVPKRETYFTVGFLNLDPETWISVHVFSFTIADFHCEDVSGPLLKNIRRPRNVIYVIRKPWPRAFRFWFPKCVFKLYILQKVFFTNRLSFARFKCLQFPHSQVIWMYLS